MEIYKIDIIEKINNLLKENLDEILSKTPIIEQEIKDLELLSKEKIISSKGNDINWGNTILIKNLNRNSTLIKLYKNMLYYSSCNELKEKILTSKDNKERMRYGAQMEKFGLKSLLKFINSLGNEALGKLNRKIIESMFRVPLMLKIWNDSINQINVKNFLTNLKQEKIKN